MIDPAFIEERLAGSFAGDLGVQFDQVDEDGARGRIVVDKRHLHPRGLVHGGVWVSLADTVAAWATIARLPEGYEFSTAEMKVNLFGAAREGDVLEAEAQPLHVGKRTHVWEVRVTVRERLCALFVCTQVLVAL